MQGGLLAGTKLAACGQKPPPPQPVVRPVRVTFWGERAAGQPRAAVERGLIAAFHEVEPRIDIQYQGGAQAPGNKLAEALAAGQAADVFGLTLEEFGVLQVKNVLAEVDYSVWGVKTARQLNDFYLDGTIEPLIGPARARQGADRPARREPWPGYPTGRYQWQRWLSRRSISPCTTRKPCRWNVTYSSTLTR